MKWVIRALIFGGFILALRNGHSFIGWVFYFVILTDIFISFVLALRSPEY